ncbi:MAG TPA: hypothetical protein DCL77_12685 [Prolixibacteraceae bacterium]|jgi:hypothetical protein|nr:hypothetical protein [Prolixibacteraceae bacterium]
MKTKIAIVAGIIFLLISGFQPSDRKERKLQKEKDMIQLIDSGHFRFVATSARSNLGNFNNLGVSYDLVFDSLRFKAYLPYYGRAYSVPYGGEGGVKFDLKAKKIEKKWNKRKKMFTIATEVSDQNDSYSIFLTASPSGYADLKINFRNRQMISYYGNIESTK